jgi:uroporphyrinogen-III decarboxylase
MGNVPTSLLVTGTAEDVTTCCRRLIETAGKDGGYILAPGGVADNSKAQNINAMLKAAKAYGVYRKMS